MNNNGKDRSIIGLDYSLDKSAGYSSTFSIIDQIKNIRPNFCVVRSESNRAISESAITTIVNESCEPIIRFHLPLNKKTQDYELEALLKAYRNWGVKRVIFFDQPNLISTWGSEAWIQRDLINRFLDRIIFTSELSIELGLSPVFPPLDPLGNFPDLTFFRQCLENLQIRNPGILDFLELSVLAWTHKHDLNWGAGGINIHPLNRESDEMICAGDHRSIRIYEWYDQICQAIIQKSLPIHLLQTGLVTNCNSLPKWDDVNVLNEIISLANNPNSVSGCNTLPISDYVLSCNLAVQLNDHQPSFPIVQSLMATQSGKGVQPHTSRINQPKELTHQKKPIDLYVLLPSYDWGVSDWHLEAIKTFVKNHRPAVGFSLDEAKLASQVIIINDQGFFEADQIDDLRSCDCLVEELNQSGTSIASILSAR